NGIDATGYNAPNVNAYAGLKTNIRELLARVKMFIDLGIDKQPHFLGEKIIIE
ncbi:MAG: vancomycin high temperature exclusion protein, partial [Bacteroides ovatus]|nr:vancomycin high temperature exclusion protein [Bacteroides ovatus]